MIMARRCTIILSITFVLFLVDVSLTKENNKRDAFCPFTVKSYSGCFSDRDSTPFFVPHNVDDPTISPVTAEACACQCGNQDYKYAALINLNECYCSNSYNTSATSTKCVNKCVDNSTQLCGGFDDGTNSVYSVYSTTIGCDPVCNETQTCQKYDNSFWMCTPSCEFTADFAYEIPCTDSGSVYLNVTSNTHHKTNFTYSLDGAANVTAPYNQPLSFTFQTSVPHSFQIWNRFECTVTRNITLPSASVPNANSNPALSFDVSSMQMEAKYFKLLYPSESGNVKLNSYNIDYRHKCPSDSSSSYSDWVTVTSTDIEHEDLFAPFQYSLAYDVRVYSKNCVGTSAFSSITTETAPSSPFVPTILNTLPSTLPTTGGILTVSGLYFSDSPSVLLDGEVNTNVDAKTATSIVVHIGPGQGSHAIAVRTHANFSCQEMTSSAFTWNYAAPVVQSTSVLSNAGGKLVINGTNFGLVGAANVSVNIDDTPCGTCTVTDAHKTISCESCPPGSGSDHSLVVQVAGISSPTFSFTYAICDPMCIFGECVANNVCACEDGYGGADCSALHICANDMAKTAKLGSVCGECTDTSVCCQISSLV